MLIGKGAARPTEMAAAKAAKMNEKHCASMSIPRTRRMLRQPGSALAREAIAER
jgi:hypothetical protein